MRKVLIAVGVLAVLGAAVVWFIAGNLDEIIRRAIESYGSDVVGTRVEVSGVETRLTEARASIAGLRVANPAGFGADLALELEGISVTLDPASLQSQPLVIREIRIAQPVVTLELDAQGRSNVAVLQGNIDRHGRGSGTASEPEDAPEAAAETRLVIERVQFEGGEIRVDATRAGDKEARSVELPAFALRDIGRKPDGVTPGEAGKQILAALVRRAARAAASARLQDELSERMGEAGQAIGEGVDEALDKLFRK